jgi:hypothetical protein
MASEMRAKAREAIQAFADKAGYEIVAEFYNPKSGSWH